MPLITLTLNQFENEPIILAHEQNFPSCARDMLLLMISSLYCTEHVLFFICLLEGLGIILILILIKNFPWIYSYQFISIVLYLQILTIEALIEGYGKALMQKIQNFEPRIELLACLQSNVSITPHRAKCLQLLWGHSRRGYYFWVSNWKNK